MAKSSDVLWRASNPNGGPGVTVRRSPATYLYRTDGTRFFGTRVKAVRVSEIDVEMVEGSARRTLTCSRSLAPAAIVDDALCVRVTGDGIASYEVAEVFPTRFASAADEDSPLGVGIVPGIVGGIE